MSKPPKIVIPGLNRGAGVPPGFVLGRLPGTGKGPAQLLNLEQLRKIGLATAFTLTTSTSQVQSIAHSETISLSRSVSTSLSAISSSLSGAVSSTTSLSSAVSTVISGSISTVNSRIDSLSTAGGGGADDDTALSTSLSSAVSTNVTQSTSLSQISSSLSAEISTDLSRINSLSTAVGAGGGTAYEGGPAGTIPAVGGWTTWNLGTSSLSTSSHNHIFTPQNGGVLRGYYTAVPGAPYNLYMRLRNFGNHSTLTGFQNHNGIILRDDTTGKTIACVLDWVNPGVGVSYQITRWTSAGAFVSTGLSQFAPADDCANWLRVNVTSTTVTLSISYDGWDWIQIGTETILTYLTAISHYGFAAYQNSTTVGGLVVSYFSTTAPV